MAPWNRHSSRSFLCLCWCTVQFTSRTCEIYDGTCCLLRRCTLFFRQEVNFPCIKQAVLLMGDEKRNTKGISLPFSRLFGVGKNCRHQKGCWAFLSSASASCQWALTSFRQRERRIHTNARGHTRMQTVPCNLLSPNYSRLEPMLLSLILSVRALWGNSDISVWCLPYVTRALPGPIKLIFNVCPTLDGPSQGWHSSRGDMIGIW